MITNELISEIKSKINDNQKQAITGGVLQGVLVDMTNGLTTTGLTFLGIIGPGDPAPSNEPTKGYYLSFQASTKETPYFNSVHLHRYSMLIWTQDETGRWKFKRVKYEDHRGPKRVVVGRALPIHYKNDSYTIHLSGDGTRDTYAICGRQVLRGEEKSKLAHHLPDVYGTGRKSNNSRSYVFIQFRKEDDGVTLGGANLSAFIKDRRISNDNNLRACSEAYEVHFHQIYWRPKIVTSKSAIMLRVIRDNRHRTRPDGSNVRPWVVKNIPGGLTRINKDGVYRRAKRYKKINLKNRAAGLSENYIERCTGNTLYSYGLVGPSQQKKESRNTDN